MLGDDVVVALTRIGYSRELADVKQAAAASFRTHRPLASARLALQRCRNCYCLSQSDHPPSSFRTTLTVPSWSVRFSLVPRLEPRDFAS